MPVKVLGQTVSTAPSTASTLANLVKDPSFENLTSGTTTTTNSAVASVMPGTNNYWQTNNGHTWPFYFRANDRNNVSADSGNQFILTGPGTSSLTNNADVTLFYGFIPGVTVANVTSQGAVDRNLAVKLVENNTTHYYGAKYYTPDNTGVGTATILVSTFNSDGQNITTFNSSVTSLTTGSWQTIGGSFNPGVAKYATIRLRYQANSNMPLNNYVAWDSVWVSSNATYSGTYPNADGTTALTAPFDNNGIVYAGPLGAAESIRSFPGPITSLYTVPAGSSAVVSTITVSNLSTRFNFGNNNPGYTQSVPVRIAVLPSGETLAKKHFIVFDSLVSSNTTQTFTIGMTLSAGDRIQVSAPTNDVTFTAFGSEN
jgi:hypothetical protein